MDFSIADLCDAHDPDLQVAEPRLVDFGGSTRFGGSIRTVKAFEDNSLVRQALSEPGEGQVLVVDGGGSLCCAMLGDRLGALAVNNGWQGVVLNGCVRDTEELSRLSLGVRALAAHPRKSLKRNEGQRDVVVRFLGVAFEPGHHLYADRDGLVVSSGPLVSKTSD